MVAGDWLGEAGGQAGLGQALREAQWVLWLWWLAAGGILRGEKAEACPGQ